MESMNHIVWVMKMHHWLMVDPILTHYCLWRLPLSQRSPEPPRVLCSTGEEREKMYFTAESFIRTIARFLQAFRARADRRPSHQRSRRARDPRRRGVRDASCWPARRFSNAPPPQPLSISHTLMMTLGLLLITICVALLIILPLSCTILTPEAWDGHRWLTAS